MSYPEQSFAILEKASKIISEAKETTLIPFSESRRNRLSALDNEEYDFHCFNLQTSSGYVLTLDNEFMYNGFLAQVDLLPFPLTEETFEKYKESYFKESLEEEYEEGLRFESVSEEQELKSIFVEEWVNTQLLDLEKELRELNKTQKGFIISPSLVYNGFLDSDFYESSRCW